MVTERKHRINPGGIRYGTRLFFLISLTFFHVASDENSCPVKCQCYLGYEPRKISCTNQRLANYPDYISDLVQHLDLSKNFLEYIPSELNNLIDLEYLNLAQNKLKSLPTDLHQLERLQKLDLSRNNIASISDIFAIKYLPSLKVLHLSKNAIADFEDFTNDALRALDLSHCAINSITDTSLSGLPELVTLSLKGNPLKSIQRLTSDKLRWLDLSDCSLNYLSPDTFEGAPGLEQLRLSNNPLLVYSSRNETLRHNNLKFLDVSRCNLDRPGLHGFPTLSHAILSHNVIRMLPDRIFAKNKMLEQLYLNGNGLNSVNRSSFATLTNLEVLDLSSNNLAHLHNFVVHDAINLRLLNLSYNDFEDFPTIVSALLSLDVSSNFIETVPRQFSSNFPRIETLNLNDNRLEGECDRFQSSTLKHLLLKRNRLVDIANDSYSELPELRTIDLSGNRLTEAMNLDVFASNENLRIIRLEDNPWRCDCHQLRPTFIYLTGLPEKTISETLICQSPSNVSGFSWEAACYHDWHESRDNERDRTWGIVMLCLLIIVLVFGTSVSITHSFTMKRRERQERARRERDEGLERLRLLRRRNLELESAANRRDAVEPRIHPLELINPPPYEEAVQMPRMAQSLDALDSISMESSRQVIGSVDNLRGRKNRRRRPRNRSRSEDNLSRREGRVQERRVRSISRSKIESHRRSVGGESALVKTTTIIETHRETESEERSSDSRRRPKAQTPNSKRQRRRQAMNNGNSTDDEDSDIQRVVRKPETNLDMPIVIRELPREPRSAYRPSISVEIV